MSEKKMFLRPNDSLDENDLVEISLEAAAMSSVLEGMAEEGAIIPVEVQKDVLKKVVAFCEKHVNEPMTPIFKPIASTNMRELVGEWDAAFIDVDQELLFNVVRAADFLGIKDLVDLGCAKVASMIKDRTPSEIRTTFRSPT